MPILRLPLPPSPNDWAKHPLGLHRQKNRYRRAAWAAAVQQEKPLHDPPKLVEVSAMFLVWRLRDEDALTGSLKWVLDCLKQRQTGKLRWRCGLYDALGYFIEDSPKFMRLGEIWQNPCSRDLQQVVVEIKALAFHNLPPQNVGTESNPSGETK